MNAQEEGKPNLEDLLSEFVAELKRPLDRRVLSLFSQCADRISCPSASAGKDSPATAARRIVIRGGSADPDGI